MSEENSTNDPRNCCSYCGEKLPIDFPQEGSEGDDLNVCENCGTEIIKKNDILYDSDSKEKKKFSFNHLYEFLSNKKSSNDRILGDSDFPLIFTENYIIVVSRIIYFHFLEMKKDLEFDFQKGELTEEIVEIVNKKIKPITEKGIQPEFLKNLKNLSRKRFEKWLKFQQSKLEVSEKYFEDLTFFLQGLIEKVFTIITELWNEKGPPKFDRIIRDDLKNFEVIVNGSVPSLSNQVLKEINDFSSNFKNSDILTEKAIEVYNDLINGPKLLRFEDLPSGFRSNPKYLASSLIYYGLRHEEYSKNRPEYMFHGILDYIETNYPKNTTMKTAITNIVPKVYDYISDSLKLKILYYPKKGHNVNKDIREKIKFLKDRAAGAEFLSSLKSCINKYSINLLFPEKLSKITLGILNDSIRSPFVFSYNDILDNNVWFNSPEAFAVCFLFLGYHHVDYRASKLLRISEYSERYFPNNKDSLQANVSFIYNYISANVKNKIQYLPTQTNKIECLDNIENSETWRILKNLLEIFKIDKQEVYLTTAKQIFTLAKQNGFNYEGITRSHYLACVLLYYSLLKEDYSKISKKKIINTLKPTIYSIWDKGFYRITNEFGAYIDVKQAIMRYDFDKLSEELLKIRNKYKDIQRLDNVLLVDLILESLNFCKSNFKDFIPKLALIISKKKKPSAIIEKLLIPNNFDKISLLEDFVNKYKSFIEELSISQDEKNKIRNLLYQFENSKRNFYKFEEKKSEKIEREKLRYGKYKKYFYSHKIRVKRFLLMLGFSPFDGFDIWDNKLMVKDKYRIFANFHHYHYTPEGQSEEDLVFIPTKPPKKIRNGEYLTKDYLSHNSISGLEGNLKRDDISKETRSRILKKLQEIESIIEFNSHLIEKAVYTQSYEIFHNLKNWSEVDIKKAIKRLNDDSFLWAKGVEDYLPTADGYNRNRIDEEERESIIKGIIDKQIRS